MKQISKYIITISLILCVSVFMALPVFGAVVSQDISSEQMQIIMNINDFAYVSGDLNTFYQNQVPYQDISTDNSVELFTRSSLYDNFFTFQTAYSSIVDNTLLVHGSINATSGAFTDGGSNWRTDYISYSSGTTLYVSGYSTRVTVWYYDSSHSPLYHINVSGPTSSYTNANVAYFAVYIPAANYSSTFKIQVETYPSLNLNIPLFLSGFDSLTIQFAVAGTAFDYKTDIKCRAIHDSVGTLVDFDYLGTLPATNIPYPDDNVNTVTRNFALYQVTLTEDIDILQFCLTVNNSAVTLFQVSFGITGVSVVVDDSVIQGIAGQIFDINNKIDDLIDAIGDLQLALDGLVIQNGDIVTNLEEINNIASSIEENQELMLYLTENEELVVQTITANNTSNTTKINQYISIMQQYAQNYPTVNNIENIIEAGIPSSADIAVAVAPIQSLFDATWFIGILATVGAVALLSYVLFGKR